MSVPNFFKSKFPFQSSERYSILLFTIKWTLICSIVGFMVGSASSLFLVSLEWVTQWRESNLWVVALLPLGGLAIGLIYHYLGKGIEGGNNLLIDNLHKPGNIIPLKMAPMVLFGTLVTHLVGGSAGREGTAVQMGGAIADQFTKLLKLTSKDRKILIIIGISAGFSSVFGTPLAGAIFGLEVFLVGKIKYYAIFPALLAALIADYVTQYIWHVGHTSYHIGMVPHVTPMHIIYALCAGICFGITARFFSQLHHFFSHWFKKLIAYGPFRPVVGGAILALVFFVIYQVMHTTKYMGLGVPTIVDSFSTPSPAYDFALKLLLTAFTLSCGFKGGEVTPLFFIGATLGSALTLFLPLPTALLAGMGFVAVFAGAANTPIACIFMGIELFGASSGVYLAIACIIAYLFSGHGGIYASQVMGSAKHASLKSDEGYKLSDIQDVRKGGSDHQS